MKRHRTIIAVLAALGTVSAGASLFAQSNPPPQSIDERIEKLEEEVRQLKQQREMEQAAAAARTNQPPLPVIVAGADGFGFKSADGSFALKVRGYVQADGRFYLEDHAHAAGDTFLLRRVRPILEGTVYKDFGFRIMPDFGGGSTVLYDAYIDWKHWREFQVRVGKFKPPVGLERLQSGTALEFVERALPTDLVPNRDVGVQVSGDLWGGVVGYAAGVFNGVPDGGSGDVDSGDAKEFEGRLFVQPFQATDIGPLRGLGVGIAGSWGDQAGSASSPNLPSYKSVGQQTFFSYISKTNAPGVVFADGEHTRWSPQGYYYWGPFGLLAEYVVSDQEVQRGKGGSHSRLSHNAWQVAGYFVLTGEKASYNGVTPRRPFDLKGGWGAFELVARYDELHIDSDAFPTFADPTASARDAHEWGVGLNWYVNRNVKWAFDYHQTGFDGGGTTGGNRTTERVVFGRMQLAF